MRTLKNTLISWVKITLFAFLPLALLGYFYLERVHLIGLVSLYGAISVGRILFQVISSWIVRNKVYPALTMLPPAAVIVAVYNENKEAFTQCLQSLKNQSYPMLDIIVVDDGSDNAEEIKSVCTAHGVQYHQIAHGGKRAAMYHGFNLLSPQVAVVLTSDSDTVWDESAAGWLVQTTLSDKTVGAATGFVDTLNTNVNLLTKIIHLRYWIAFQQERASQSIFGAVTCISGPLGAYRREIIDQIKENFINQKFLGKQCTFGDDRHLTNLVLGLGYKVLYSPAKAYTEAPTNLMQFIKQQARWGKSHWREMIWQWKALPKQNLYLAWDWGLTLVLPFLLVLSIGHYVYLAATDNPAFILPLLGTVILMSLLRVIAPIAETREWAFLLFVFYSFFHLFVLLPLKFYSLATVNLTGWGTRGTKLSNFSFIKQWAGSSLLSKSPVVAAVASSPSGGTLGMSGDMPMTISKKVSKTSVNDTGVSQPVSS